MEAFEFHDFGIGRGSFTTSIAFAEDTKRHVGLLKVNLRRRAANRFAYTTKKQRGSLNPQKYIQPLNCGTQIIFFPQKLKDGGVKFRPIWFVEGAHSPELPRTVF